MSSEVPASPSASSSTNTQRLRVRREPFEYGLLPLPSLVFPDPSTYLLALRTKLLTEDSDLSLTLTRDSHGNPQIDAAGIAQVLDLADDEAQLVVETLLSVLPDSSGQKHSVVDSSVAVSLDDLLLFLYIQNYKKPQLRPHKDAASVADVWPSSSPFDRLVCNLSPLQVRTSKKTSPCQADEESHQLAYIQKHLPVLLSLVTDLTRENELDGQVLRLDQFNHLGLVVRYGERGSDKIPLSQSCPFFANSDADMPAAPVPLQQVLEWLLEHISTTSDGPQQKGKENGQIKSSDITMTDACGNVTSPGILSPCNSTLNRNWCEEDLTFVDGITKMSVLKNESDINGGSVKVVNCHESVVYILAPIKYASVYGCSDSIIVLGAVEKVVRIEHCERVQLIVSSARICITNCRECIFYLTVNQRPLILGENHKLQVAPYNTFYPKLEAHIAQVGITPSVNRWDKFLTLGVVDPHGSLPHSADVADTLVEGASILPPDRFINFVIPKWSEHESSDQSFTKSNPFQLPKAYLVALQQRNKAVDVLRQTLKSLVIDENRKQELSQAIHVHFREWLYASGSIRQLYEFQDT